MKLGELIKRLRAADLIAEALGCSVRSLLPPLRVVNE